MTARPLSPAMQKALAAMLKGPLARSHDKFFGDGWQAADKSMHALSVVRALHQRGLTLAPTRLVVLSIAGRQEAQRINGAGSSNVAEPRLAGACRFEPCPASSSLNQENDDGN